MNTHLKQSAQTLEPAIPKLKEEQRERRGAGLPYSWGAGGAGARLGYTGAGAATGQSLSGGFLGLQGMALALSQVFGGPGTFLGALFASKLGWVLLTAGMLSWIGLGGAFTLTPMQPSKARKSTPAFPSRASVPGSKIVIDAPKNNSLDYLRKANAGQLPSKKEAPAESEDSLRERPETEASLPAPQEAPAEQDPAPNIDGLVKKSLSREGFLQKPPHDKAFGPSAGLNRNKLGSENFELKKTFSPAGTANRFNLLASSKRGVRNIDGSVKRVASAGAGRAMRQLKSVERKSRQAYAAPDASAARQYAADAFEQGTASYGTALGLLDSAASDSSLGSPYEKADVGSVPDVGESSNATPYQDQVDSAKDSGDSAGNYKAIGVVLMLVGAVLMALGAALSSDPATAPIGAVLLVAGIAALAIGTLFLALALSAAESAADSASAINDDYGQSDQAVTAERCSNKSYDTGTSVDEVCPDA